eukprot:m.179518 g.179518  ORF g.179518 m.179518 type:complete len:560 (-) comp14641_c4_seq1:227-1906(-)
MPIFRRRRQGGGDSSVPTTSSTVTSPGTTQNREADRPSSSSHNPSYTNIILAKLALAREFAQDLLHEMAEARAAGSQTSELETSEANTADNLPELSVSKLKANVSDFTYNVALLASPFGAIRRIICWEDPRFSAIFLLCYFIAVWTGHMFQFLLLLLIGALASLRGATLPLNEHPDRGFFERMALLREVAQKVQLYTHKFNLLAERLVNFAVWRCTQTYKFTAILAGLLIVTVILPSWIWAPLLQTLVGLRLLVLEGIYQRFPRMKAKYDSDIIMSLPTNEDLVRMQQQREEEQQQQRQRETEEDRELASYQTAATSDANAVPTSEQEDGQTELPTPPQFSPERPSRPGPQDHASSSSLPTMHDHPANDDTDQEEEESGDGAPDIIGLPSPPTRPPRPLPPFVATDASSSPPSYTESQASVAASSNGTVAPSEAWFADLTQAQRQVLRSLGFESTDEFLFVGQAIRVNSVPTTRRGALVITKAKVAFVRKEAEKSQCYDTKDMLRFEKTGLGRMMPRSEHFERLVAIYFRAPDGSENKQRFAVHHQTECINALTTAGSQ